MKRILLVSAITLGALPTLAQACATCGCSLSSDAATGYSSSTGWTVGLQYDYINQSQLRSGTHAVSAAEVAAINDMGGDQEVEKNTTTHYITLGIGYAFSQDWNVRMLLPYVDRSHSTYGDAANPLTPNMLSEGSVSSIGDAKLIASYQGFLPTHNFGLQVGVKLPTGNYGGPDAFGTGVAGRRPAAFTSGPLSLNPSPANLIDSSLQAGTGSTDIILGAYYYQPVSQDFDAFVNGQFQSAVKEELDQAGANFRPGNLATVSFGLRYEATPDIVPQVQVNITHKSHDQGTLADTGNTSGTAVYLSPGLTARVGQRSQVYAFVQLPVHSNLQGYQLFPRWTGTLGVSYAF
ncbi:MAG: transporter [Betaproteobacteria bacterium]|nr:transporter [Betaproteobacteria bacterium]